MTRDKGRRYWRVFRHLFSDEWRICDDAHPNRLHGTPRRLQHHQHFLKPADSICAVSGKCLLTHDSRVAMSAYNPTPDNPNRYNRPLGANELYIKLIGDSTDNLGRSYWSINSWVNLHPSGKLSDSSVLQQQLLKAWAHLRFQQPSIAAYVSENGGDLVYDVPNAKDSEVWVKESFGVDEEAENVQEVMKRARIGYRSTGR
jgi:hypothetical protein